MSTDRPDDVTCAQHLAYLCAGIENWLHLNADDTSQDRDRALSGILADLLLHLDRLSGNDVETTVATFTAEERILRVLDAFGIAPNDGHAAMHLAMSCALLAHDPDAVRTAAWVTWQNHHTAAATTADDSASITASMFQLPRQ